MLLDNNYLVLIFFLFLALIIAIALTALSYFSAGKQNISDLDKISAYECGFDPFEDTRIEFDVRFYLVSILFIVFDLEIMYLFPWSMALSYLQFKEIFVMIQFLVILTIGFIYEWYKGALDSV